MITGLDTGGAEMMLCKLLSATREHLEHQVVSLQAPGTVAGAIARLGIPIHSLGIRRSLPNPLRTLLVVGTARRFRPDVIQGWMYHGNLVATLAAAALPKRPMLAWNIRQTLYDLAYERPLTATAVRIGALVSSVPDRIVYNSSLSRQQHEAFGYRREKGETIGNGFDCEVFHPDEDARQTVRRELGVANDVVLIGLVARYHPMKDHANFLRAAAQVAAQEPKTAFVLMGEGTNEKQAALTRLISEMGLGDRVHLLGERTDVARVTAALDIACSASAWGEGFSNTVAEAMATGVPAVVTDIGDNPLVVGATGVVVPARDPTALATAVTALVRDKELRLRLGEAARQRIQREFSLAAIARKYVDVYTGAVAHP